MQILQPQKLHLIRINEQETLFLHTESLQIYPFDNDNELLKFITYLRQYGELQTKKRYGITKFNMFSNVICQTISNAPESFEGFLPPGPTFSSVNMPISGHCNLNCPYCFAQTDGGFHFGDYTEDDMIRTIDFVAKQSLNESEPKTIVFFGGEPLLKFNLIKFAVQYIQMHYGDKVFNYSITTNGTICNKEIISFLQANNISLLVSIDGPDNEFNLRKYQDGRKSLDTVLSNIRHFHEAHINILLRATIVNTNPYIFETFRFFEEELAIPFVIEFVQSSENTQHNYAEYNVDIVQRIQQQLQVVETYYLDKIKAHLPIYNRVLFERSETLRFRKKIHTACGAGNTYFTITSNGDIFVCPMFMNTPDNSIGNIQIEIINHKKLLTYKAILIDNITDCSTCWAKYLCKGGCIAEKITSKKRNDQSLTEGDCLLQKIIWDFYIKLYYYIMKFAPEYIDKSIQQTKTPC